MTDRIASDVAEARLNHIIDRARRGALLPAEAEQFTSGLRDLVRRLEDTEDDLDRVQQAACRTAESLRNAEARVAEREAEREKDAAITAQIDAQTEEQINGATEVAQYYKALAKRTQAWGEQHQDRANRYRARTDAVRAELAALNSETAGLNPYAMAGRRDAVARIRAALQSISHDTPVPDDPRVAALEAENARLRAAWTSARARAKRAKRNRDGELRWANNMWSDALKDLHRCRQAWKSARHRAAMYLQSNENFSASLHSNNAAYLQFAARAEKAAREHGRAEILRAAAEHNAKDQADRRRTAEAAVESVRELHQRWDADPGSCAHCHDSYGTPLPYPCPTIRALDQPQQPTTTEA